MKIIFHKTLADLHKKRLVKREIERQDLGSDDCSTIKRSCGLFSDVILRLKAAW